MTANHRGKKTQDKPATPAVDEASAGLARREDDRIAAEQGEEIAQADSDVVQAARERRVD